MKFTTTLRIAAVLGVVAFASNAQAQTTCDATNLTSSAGLGLAASAATPNCQVATTATADVKHVLRLSITGTATVLGDATNGVTMQQFDSTAAAGANDNALPFNLGPQVSAKGNRPYEVKIHRSATNFTYAATGDASTYTGLGTPVKPGSDLKYAVAPNTTELVAGFAAVPVAGSAAIILDSAVDGYSSTKQIQYRTAWNYSVDRPGNYSIGIVYTIVGK